MRKIALLALALVCAAVPGHAESILANAMAKRIDAWLSEARGKLPYAITDTVIVVDARSHF
jgi:hypothetical protein